MCEKISYPTQGAAKDAASAMFSKGKRRVMGHYFCTQGCNAWHLTSHDKKKKLKKYHKLKYKNKFLEHKPTTMITVPDNENLPFDYSETDASEEIEFEMCDDCDGHPACEDFGCAFKLGLGHLVQPPL